MNVLSQILSSKIRAELFRLLFGVKNVELHMRALEREAGCSIGSIQSELKKLRTLQLVLARRNGNRLYYRANRDHPLYPDIHSMVLKTSGLVDYLKNRLEPCEEIQTAFVFGSIASGAERAESDIDLLIIGWIGLRAVSSLLADFQQTVGRELNPHVFSREEFCRRRAQKEHFVSNVLSSPKLFVKGSEHELAKMG